MKIELDLSAFDIGKVPTCVFVIGCVLVWYFVAGLIVRWLRIKDGDDRFGVWLLSPVFSGLFVVVTVVWTCFWLMSAGAVCRPWKRAGE